ncbi:hypothetical protein [Blautia luti]|uniref:hypothetical protein n=1 Tax=Blautia luti TaxID=89014 RepID=UPI0018A9A590|nr:hypothetical protein [Blautia luti]
MSMKEFVETGGSVLLIALTLVQVAPIRINPWSTIARAIGKALNADLNEKMDANEAKTARYRILRFDDEIRHKIRHSKEHFDQIIEDVDTYERYCQDHPRFPNGKAVSATDNVKRTYEKCKAENSFL